MLGGLLCIAFCLCACDLTKTQTRSYSNSYLRKYFSINVSIYVFSQVKHYMYIKVYESDRWLTFMASCILKPTGQPPVDGGYFMLEISLDIYRSRTFLF